MQPGERSEWGESDITFDGIWQMEQKGYRTVQKNLKRAIFGRGGGVLGFRSISFPSAAGFG